MVASLRFRCRQCGHTFYELKNFRADLAPESAKEILHRCPVCGAEAKPDHVALDARTAPETD